MIINVFYVGRVSTLHMYNSANYWTKQHDTSCFLNSLIGITNIPMATTCLTFISQLPWAEESCSSLSETTHLFCTVFWWEWCRLLQGSTTTTPHTPSKLQTCFWEQRPSRGQLGTSPYPPAYYFLLLGWQRNCTPANLISICFIWSLAYFACQSAYPNYYWAPGSGHS